MRSLHSHFAWAPLLYALGSCPVIATPGQCLSCLKPTPDVPLAVLEQPANAARPQVQLQAFTSSSPLTPASPVLQAYGLTSETHQVLSGVIMGPIIKTRGAQAAEDYTIYCGLRNGQVKMAMDAAFQSVIDILPPGMRSPVGLQKYANLERFFPTEFEVDYATVLFPLSGFKYGRPILVQVDSDGAWLPSHRAIVCATKHMQAQYSVSNSYYDTCTQDPTIVAFNPRLSSAVILCPSFFKLPTHVQGNSCPKWNRALDTFDPSYQPSAVEYQSYTLIRGFLDALFRTPQNIVVAPNPQVKNYNTLMSQTLTQKLRSSAFYQLFLASKYLRHNGHFPPILADFFQCSNRDVSLELRPLTRIVISISCDS